MVLQLLQNDNLGSNDFTGFPREISFYNLIAHQLLSIISQFKKIKFYKRASLEQQEYINDVQKFIYIIYRLIEEAKIFKMLFSSDKVFENTVQFARRFDMTTMAIFDMLSKILDENVEYFTGNLMKSFDKAKVNYVTTILEIKENQSFYYYNQIEDYCKNVSKEEKNENFISMMNRINRIKLNSSNIQLDKNQKINLFVKNIRNSILNISKNASSVNFEKYIGYMNDLGFQLTKINKLE